MSLLEQDRRRVRPPAVVGMFYPKQPDELRNLVRSCLADGRSQRALPRKPRALVAPHAGYPYSGPVAGAAYGAMRDLSGIRRVIVIGPAHRLAFSGIATVSATHFATPLGLVEVDQQALRRLESLPFVHCIDEAHVHEHGLEVQLPFLMEVLDTFKLAPLVVGDAPVDQVRQVLETAWPAGAEDTFVIVSSDLSHYLDYDSARNLDAQTTRAIEALMPEAISAQQACGSLPLRAMLSLAQDRRLEVVTLDVRNSGDTAGPRQQVVGYGAYAFV